MFQKRNHQNSLNSIRPYWTLFDPIYHIIQGTRRQFNDHQRLSVNLQQNDNRKNLKSFRNLSEQEFNPEYQFKDVQCIIGKNPSDGRKRLQCPFEVISREVVRTFQLKFDVFNSYLRKKNGFILPIGSHQKQLHQCKIKSSRIIEYLNQTD